MTKYNSYIKIKCKCGDENCKLMPTQGYNGYAYSHAPLELREEIKERSGTKHKQSLRKRAIKANITKNLWVAQKKIGASKSQPKRSVKPIARNSKKRIEELKIYRLQRKDYLADNQFCKCGRNGCKRKSQDVHHKKGRQGHLLNEIRFWLPVARVCHTWITEHPKEAMELGLIISRLSKV